MELDKREIKDMDQFEEVGVKQLVIENQFMMRHDDWVVTLVNNLSHVGSKACSIRSIVCRNLYGM